MSLRARLASGPPLAAPGVADALAARLAAQAGFELLFLSGAGLSWTQLGQPDIGLVTLTELTRAVERITDAAAVPLLADADTGFGNAANVQRSVRALEAAGAAAIQIEDQGFPKRCGHMAGKTVIPLAEAAGKVRAAVAARRSADTLISARTDALSVEGVDAALARAHAYAEAGADLLFVEAPLDAALLARIAGELAMVRPLVVNMVEAGAPSPLTARDLGAMGYRVVLFPVALARAAAAAEAALLETIARDGHIGGGPAVMAWDALHDRLDLPALLAAGRTYGDDS
ncbi:MAG: isocitrate lyase/phosphoenolpyruvate mutase family protein [Alphaproteobacteria bacterium]|nr:isocitrate lyase/phosphoenolpyruvate mutase family protein [Alphaproteobacteria bacterium]